MIEYIVKKGALVLMIALPIIIIVVIVAYNLNYGLPAKPMVIQSDIRYTVAGGETNEVNMPPNMPSVVPHLEPWNLSDIPSVWKKFADTYTQNNWEKYEEDIIENIFEQANKLGLNATSLWNCIHSTDDFFKENISSLPCYAEYATVDNKSAWILVFNYAIPSLHEYYLGRIAYFAIDAESYNMLVCFY